MNATCSRMPVKKIGAIRQTGVSRGAGALVLLLCAVASCPAKARAQADAAGLYKAKCAVFYGETGDGNTAVGKGMKLRDLRSPEVQKQTSAEVNTIICCGKGKMPGYQGKLTDTQITQFVGYMRTLAGKK